MLNYESVEQLTLRAELYLVLSHAAVPPMRTEQQQAMLELLSDDLEALIHAQGLNPLLTQLHQLKSSLERLAENPLELLRGYSHLFLSPPVRVRINAGFHLDGAAMAQSTLEMEALYNKHNVAQSEHFRDLPDHLAMQLEFIGFLMASAAEALEQGDEARRHAALTDAACFTNRYMEPWLAGFAGEIQHAAKTEQACAPYAALASIIGAVVAEDAPALAERFPPTPREVVEPAIDRDALRALHRQQQPPSIGERSCRICGNAFLPEGEIATIIEKLEERGLATDHLRVCPDCRVSELGLAPMKPIHLGKHGI